MSAGLSILENVGRAAMNQLDLRTQISHLIEAVRPPSKPIVAASLMTGV